MLLVNQNISTVNHFERRHTMTNMRRTSVSLPPELADRIISLRKDDRFIKCSYSELIRQLAEFGLETLEREKESAG